MKLGWWQRIQKSNPLKALPYTNYILLIIIILGLLIRVYRLTSLPMYGDELTMVYDSYSILKTGMDQTGEPFPLTFKMGAGRPAGYVYGSIPFVAIFGPTEWGVRSLSLLSGIGLIVLMYFMAEKLFSTKVGLWASFLTSISIWDIYLSRAGFEAHFALFLAVFGVLMLLHKKYILMALFWGTAIFTYPTFKLTLPLLFLILVTMSGFRETFKNNKFKLSLLVLSIFALFSLNETFRGTSEARFLDLNVFSDSSLQESIVQKINEQRTLSALPEKIKPYIYNKPLAYSRILFENYVENLSPNFLFLRGDRNPRANPGEWGMLYLVDALLLVVGLYKLANTNKKNLWLLISWILIVPIATMLMGQTHGLRNNLMLPAFILIFAYAISGLSKKWVNLVLVLISVQLAYVLVTIYYFAPNKFGGFWSKEAKEISMAATNVDRNINITLSTDIDNIEYAYPVYAKIDPQQVISQYGKFPKVYDNVTINNE